MLPPKKIVPFLVPDGAFYIAIAKGVSKKSVFESLSKLEEIFSSHKKVRLVWDDSSLNGEIWNSLQKIIEKARFNLKIKKYETNFFKVNLSEFKETLDSHPNANWQNYNQKYLWKEMDPDFQYDYNLVLDFMLDSFGGDFKKVEDSFKFIPNSEKRAKILKNYPLSLQNPLLKTFIIQDIEGNLAGCYSLVDVYGDIQLHSVAGMVSRPNVVKAKKLPILIASIFDIIKEKYPFAKSLTFSNSKDKVSNLYKNLGIKINPERQGYFVEKR